MGSHSKPNCGEFDTWLTPKSYIWALGPFDLDPCAAPSPRPWETANFHIELPEDGLAADWGEGRVWLNPPYGRDIGRWLQKMAKHGSGTSLIFARTETEAWHDWVWSKATGLLFLKGRIRFCLPDGTPGNYTGGAPSAFVAYSDYDFAKLRMSGIPGHLVKLR